MAMMGKIFSFSIITLLLVSAAMVIVPFAYSQKPEINSQWTNSPPTIDGKFTAGEWSNLQIVMTEPDFPIDAFAYFMNDGSNLYVLVDAIEDTTQDTMDEIHSINIKVASFKLITLKGNFTVFSWKGSSPD